MGHIIGSLLAFYFLVGRWNFLRLDGEFDEVPMYAEPRVWTIALIGCAVFFVTSFGQRNWWRGATLSRVDAAVMAFLTYMLSTTLWAIDPPLAMEKGYEVGLLLSVTILVAIARQRDLAENILSGFIISVVAIGAMLAAVAVYSSIGGRVFTPGGGPNTFGRNMGLATVAAIYLASTKRTPLFGKVVCVGIAVLAGLMVVMCGSRGGLLSTVMGAMSLVLLAKTSLVKKTLAMLMIAAAGCVGLFFTSAGQNALEVFQHRIVHQTIERGHLANRDVLWTQAVELGQENPMLGLGLNGFRSNSWTYPHNIFLESWVEGGAVGVSLLLVALLVLAHSLWRLRDRVSRPAIAVFVVTLVAAQTSGDLYDSRGVFLLMALITPAALASTQSTVRQPSELDARRLPLGSATH